MENFYRHMRKKLDILMEGGKPIGEKWNFDAANRKKYDGKVPVPEIIKFDNDPKEIISMLEAQGVDTFGKYEKGEFLWPVCREEALRLLEDFFKRYFANFGKYEDAMEETHPFLFHSRLSFALNTKMLSPLEVVEKAEDYWEANHQEVSLAQVEGFIRQIIGWREFMRGVYWAKMPDFASMNYFEHKRKLPSFYWTGDTKMNCMKQAINNSLDHAYAHHIQRLMVTGNFALLAGVAPDELDAWYLGVYIDAIEWVEITNTRGMSQFADGGLIATKPYVSSANYIDKMSNYCKGCFYSKSKKVGDKACPFNSLYWHFFNRHKKLLSNNFRVAMMYRTWEKMDKEKRTEILKQAESYLSTLESL
jgi:deoxyribodipyrimidine photolyase-related protein